MEFTSFAYELEMFLLSPSFFESLWRNNIVISEYNIIYSLLLNILFVVPTTYSSPDIIIFTSMLPFAKIQIQNVRSSPNITIFARLRLASNDHSTIHWIRPCKIKKKQASIERAISITKRYNATSEALAASHTKGHRAHFPFVQGNRQTRFRIRGRGVVETHPSRTAAPRTTAWRPPTRTPVWAAKFIHSPGPAVSRVAGRSRIHHERAWPGPMATR